MNITLWNPCLFFVCLFVCLFVSLFDYAVLHDAPCMCLLPSLHRKLPSFITQPSPPGNMLLNPRSTSIMGMSLVPALVLSCRSRSLSLDALRLSTVSASRPAVSTRCSSLCTWSASWSTSVSNEACILRSRSSVLACTVANGSISCARYILDLRSSGSSWSKSGRTISSLAASPSTLFLSGNSGCISLGVSCIDCHAFFSSCNLKWCQCIIKKRERRQPTSVSAPPMQPASRPSPHFADSVALWSVVSARRRHLS